MLPRTLAPGDRRLVYGSRFSEPKLELASNYVQMIAALLVCLSDLFYNNNNNTHFLLLVPFIGSQLPLPLHLSAPFPGWRSTPTLWRKPDTAFPTVNHFPLLKSPHYTHIYILYYLFEPRSPTRRRSKLPAVRRKEGRRWQRIEV